MSLPKTLKKTKLPRTVNRCPQKNERKQATSYAIDGITKVNNSKFIILLI